MALLFLLLLIALPLVEISVFIEIGGEIGAGWTILLTILTALIGIQIARIQGWQAIQKMQLALYEGREDYTQLAHAGLIMVAGLFLLIPGFVTDVVGAVLLLPPVRQAIITMGLVRILTPRTYPNAYRDRKGHVVIEAEYREKTKNDKPDRE